MAASTASWQPQEEGFKEVCGLLEQHISPSSSDKSQIWQQLQHYSQFPDFNNYLAFILARAELGFRGYSSFEVAEVHIKPHLKILLVLHLILFIGLDNSADSSNLSSSACMKTIHLNDTKPKCEELSSHKPQSDLVLLDIYSGCDGMSTGLCLGAKLSGLDLVTKWALDINKFACESLKLNHPETQIRNESAEDFLDLLKEWDKLCKRYAVKDVEGATKSNIKLLRASQNNLYSKTDEKIPSGEYEVASLIDICYGDPSDTGKRGLKFQVRWVGYGPSEDTWEPIEGLSKCEDRIQDFVLKGFKAKILPWPGANFRDLSGVVVGADNVARRDPTAEPILLPSGRPLLILATIPDEKHGKSPSIVTEDNIKLLFEIQKRVDGLRANYSGSMVSLTDICMKPLGQDCATQSVLQYFKMDPKNYDDYGGVEHTEYCFQHYTSADTCMSAFKAPLDPSTALGGFSGNNYSEASAFIVTYPVNNAIDKEGNETGKAVAWEKAFIQLVKDELLPMVQSKNLTLSFSSESSIEEELKRESTADAITILISYLVMFAYISLTLGDTPRLSSIYISSKILLGLSGVMLVMLSVLGSIGFFSAIGVKSTLIIVEVIPFLVLAVGVDNMCILVHAVKRQPLELPLEGRVSNALVEVGPSITLASLSEVLAFAVGSFIPMPACRVFSMFAALAVLLDFLLQVTAFVALIVFDFLRAEDKRVDCFPCVKVSSSYADSDKGIGRRKPGLLTRYMKEVHAPILNLWGVKIVVISAFVAFALASIALCTRIEPGLEQKIVLPQDSYLQGYFNNVSEYLRIGPPLYFVVKNYNYSSESGHTNQLCSISQCDSDSLLNEIARASLIPESSYIAKPAASWLDDFLVWISPEAFGCCRKFTNGSYCPPDDQPPCCSSDQGSCSLGGVCKDCTTCFRHSDLLNSRPSTTQFREKLPWFLNALPSADCAKGGHGAYTSSVDLKGYENGIIQASEFRTYHTPLNKQDDYVNSMRAAREFSSRVSDSLKIQIFPYSVFYMFFEQYLDIWRTALINLAIAIGAVFVVCLVITCSFWSSAIILLVLAMIVVDLMGVMAILNIQLNAVSVVNLVMAVGIAVEFCVHITHAFSVSGGDRDQRTKEALGTMGASVFSGITLTKLVGVIVLCFSRTEVFVVYYFQMYLALVLLGFLHGLVFLPVVLSMFGPPSRCVLIDKREDQPSASSQL